MRIRGFDMLLSVWMVSLELLQRVLLPWGQARYEPEAQLVRVSGATAYLVK
jgi:hypothetical protein